MRFFLLHLLCCHQSRAVQRDCPWLCLFACMYFHNDLLHPLWMFSRCAVNYLPSQNRILPLSQTVFGPNCCFIIPSAASSQQDVYCLKSPSSAMLHNPVVLTIQQRGLLLHIYPSLLPPPRFCTVKFICRAGAGSSERPFGTPRV